MQLIVDGLTLVRGERHIIEELSFTLAGGEALLLTGPNGAGKTTLLRAVAGYLAPIAGSIRLDGGEQGLEIAEQCHFVGHRDGVKAGMTVAENATFWARYLGGDRKDGGRFDGMDETVTAALAALGIEALAGVPAAYLSAGQRRRLGLARLLLARRRLWLLDEPSVSLDVAGVEALAGVVAAHLAGGGIVMAATHVPLGFEAARELRLVGVRDGGHDDPSGAVGVAL